jgi:hypothetical protein
MARSWGSNPFSVEGNEPAIELRSIPEILSLEIPETDNLLGSRFLCRKGALVIIGPAGIGKSSSSVQMAMHWALGHEAFGIRPRGPLRIMFIQAENDDGDLQEMIEGVHKGVTKHQGGSPAPRFTAFEGFEPDDFRLLPPDQQDLLHQNLHFATVTSLSGEDFIAQLDQMLTRRPCAVVWLDPLLAYLGSDPTNTEALMKFLRQKLTPLLHKHNVAAIISHHTPKTTNRDTSTWSNVDYSYAGAGGAELTNWARAIMVISPTQTKDTYEFRAAKRGKRIGWRNVEGEKEYIRHFRHSLDGSLYWERADSSQVEEDKQKAKATARMKSSPPEPIIREILTRHPDWLDKTLLINMAKERGAADKACRDAISSMKDQPGGIEETEQKRPGTRNQILVRLRKP